MSSSVDAQLNRSSASEFTPDEIRRAISVDGALSIVFQPIVDLKTSLVIGHEALTRLTPDSSIQNYAELFAAAERFGMLNELESVTRRKALAAATTWNPACVLFLNNTPAAVIREDFLDRMKADMAANPGIDPARTILEIAQNDSDVHASALTARSIKLREAGFMVSIDNVGASFSCFDQIMSIRPNWLKLHRELVAHIDLDPLKQNLIRFFVHYAKMTRIGVIAEGVERREELATLIGLGVSHGQGYFLARPGEAVSEIEPEKQKIVLQLYHNAEAVRGHNPGLMRISNIMTPCLSMDVSTPLDEVRDRLGSAIPQPGVVVTNGRRCIGWLPRTAIFKPSHLNIGARTLGDLAVIPAVVISNECSLTETLEALAAREEDEFDTPLIVQASGKTQGIITIKKLVQAAAAATRTNSSQVAPLTSLPNRAQADRWLAMHITAHDPSNVAFIDLRNFNSYNAVYGFELGDSLLLRLVGLIQSRIMSRDGNRPFLAHLGEDRFMIASQRDEREALNALIADFEAALPEFFSPQDMAAKAFLHVDAAGRDKMLPLTSVRVIYLPQALLRIAESKELYERAVMLRNRSAPIGPEARTQIVEDARDARANHVRSQAG
ncbi:MAG TPA: EAL domain-containing protein [Phycisphaerales bacterium]|nr:EAL domain-containing protein [Phycisphaerales bacterium]